MSFGGNFETRIPRISTENGQNGVFPALILTEFRIQSLRKEALAPLKYKERLILKSGTKCVSVALEIDLEIRKSVAMEQKLFEMVKKADLNSKSMK